MDTSTPTYFQEKINKIDKKGISLVHIKTMDELSTKI